MTKIDDVARRAGVSTATVSRALRGLPVVSAETRARVMAAANDLGYVASPFASRLAGGRTGSVGVVVPRITRWFFATVIEAAEETLYESGWDLMLFNLNGHEQARRRLLQTHALQRRVDAVMLIATPLGPEDFSEVVGLRVPGVTVSAGTAVPGWPSIRIDDVAAGRKATQHLIDLGHTRIAHISGDPSDELGHTTPTDRRAGYETALSKAGVAADPALRREGRLTVAGGFSTARALLESGQEPPTAIFAACDEMAMGAIRAIRDAGLRVPEDVSVIGIDDHDLAGAVGLTTVAQPAARQGQCAASILLRTLQTGRDEPAQDMVLPTRLVVRASTAPPRRTAPQLDRRAH